MQVQTDARDLLMLERCSFVTPLESVPIASARAALVAEVIRREHTQFPLAQVLPTPRTIQVRG